MQKKPHAKVAKAAKPQAANFVGSLVLHLRFNESFWTTIRT